jgi:polyribonucleotide nucleotidyltransferase
MATVCAGTLSLMDAGIQMIRPVSGIAMGLITDGDRYAVLSDILGDEDHLGDMDFKVTGTSVGITACQMDIKIDGLKYEIMEAALAQARDGRLHILGKLIETLASPKEGVKTYVKNYYKKNSNAFIGALIGPGGKVIQELQKQLEQQFINEDPITEGVIEILGTDPAGIEAVLAKIKSITFKPHECKVL